MGRLTAAIEQPALCFICATEKSPGSVYAEHISAGRLQPAASKEVKAGWSSSLDVNPVRASNEKDATDLAPILIGQSSRKTRRILVAFSGDGFRCKTDMQRRCSPRYLALHRISPLDAPPCSAIPKPPGERAQNVP